MALDLAHHFDTHGTDKKRKHHYHGFYQALVDELPENASFCEIGVFRGDSMAAFLGYRPQWNAVGVDIFERVSLKAVSERLGGHEVSLFQCSSTNRFQSEPIAQKYVNFFDLVIDDGAHWPVANIETCENWIDTVKPGGSYLIEDIFPWFDMSEEERRIPWLASQPGLYNDRDFQRFTEFLIDINNSGFRVKAHDFRHLSGEPDSVIIQIRKDA